MFAAIEYGRLNSDVTQDAVEASWFHHLDDIMEYVDDHVAQEKAKWVAEAEKLEHYYSHKARKEAGYAELYWCACGKYDRDKDRLLRHVRWHELALAKLLDKENV